MSPETVVRVLATTFVAATCALFAASPTAAQARAMGWAELRVGEVLTMEVEPAAAPQVRRSGDGAWWVAEGAALLIVSANRAWNVEAWSAAGAHGVVAAGVAGRGIEVRVDVRWPVHEGPELPHGLVYTLSSR